MAGERNQVSVRDRRRSALTRRELECLRLVADGRTTADIAAAFAISENTVNHHLAAACRKLQALNRPHAVASAFRLGLIT